MRFVKGEGNYIDDFVLKEVKNYFSASIVRSPYAHAMIRSIDKSDAEKLNGVIKVITFNDIRNLLDPFPLSLDINLDFYPMAKEKTLYYGEPVAVIIAKDDYVAEDAKELLQIDYEPLESIVSIENAINSGPIHPTLKSNVILDKTLVYGKFEYEIKKSPILIEERIRFPRYSSSPLETYEILARYNGEEYEIFPIFKVHLLFTTY